MNEKTDNDSYPSSNSYASTVTENGFSFTWNGWDVQTRQGVYIHNTPYSGIWDIPFGLGSWSNPVEQPNSTWSSEPEPPEPYSSPSQRYVDDLDDFFYGYDNSDLYETGLQEYGEVTVTNASGSASYSGYENFYDDFTDGSVGNEGVGSGLTAVQKQYVQGKVEETGNEINEEYTEENSQPKLLFYEYGDFAEVLRGIHEKLSELLLIIYETSNSNKNRYDAEAEAEKLIRKALLDAWRSGEQYAIEKVIQDYSVFVTPPPTNPSSVVPMIPGGQWQPTMFATTFGTIQGNVHIGNPRLQNWQIVIPNNHVGIAINNFWDIPDLTVRTGMNITLNPSYGITNYGVGFSLEKKWEYRSSNIILQNGIQWNYNTEDHKKEWFGGFGLEFNF